MSQPRSIYQTDFTPHAWFENNFELTTDEFCSSENIDDCLKYISQELSALGYPSIYSSPSSCPFAVNCDIVKLLNALFELLKDFRDSTDLRKELDERNQRLLSDLSVVNKKNAQLKERLDQSERKYNGSLEKERQLKIKNESLQQIIKNEKEEARKLSSQIQQQKNNFQHEIRKYESRLNQMKSRLTQIISDKNPEKKIASISTTHLLSRNTNQRGKWKTGSVAKNSTEELYNSIISNYDSRCLTSERQIENYQNCLKNIELRICDIISHVECDFLPQNLPNICAILNEDDESQQKLKERFDCLLLKLKNIVMSKISERRTSEVLLSKSDISNQDPNVDNPDNNKKVLKQESLNVMKINISEADKENLEKEKKAISGELALIKDEKLKLEAQKLEMINIVTKQKSSICSKSVPSFSIITTKSGLTSVPDFQQLKQCLSTPEESVKSLPPLWKSDVMNSSNDPAKSGDVLNKVSPLESLKDGEMDDLPKWARTALTIPIEGSSHANNKSTHEISVAESFLNEDLEISALHSSEEDNLAKLQAAMEDIERRRNNQ